MKINYVSKNTQPQLTLNDIEVGELFRPTDTSMVFMRLDKDADSTLLTEYHSTLWEETFNGYIGEDFNDKDEFEYNHDYYELILCANMTDGSVGLIYKGIEVEKLNAEIQIYDN